MTTLGAVLIVKNEEVMLEDCLKSLAGFDELVVVDTGSVDSTVEIAKRYTDKVFTDFFWCDDFAAARNHALSKSTTDWVLSIDADELLVAESLELLRIAVSTAKGTGLVMTVESTAGERHQYPRCFRRAGTSWVGAIHEAPTVTQEDHCEARIIYRSSPAHLLDPDRSLRILKKDTKKNPTARNFYYLARELWYRKKYQEACKGFEKCLKTSEFLGEKADALLYQARCFWALNRGEDARKKCVSALLLNSNFKEAAEFMVELHWATNHAGWRAMARTATNEGVLFVRTKKTSEKLADVIIPHHDRHDLLGRCLAGIDRDRFNIIVASGGSFAENCNRGAASAVTARLLFVNDDVDTDSSVLEDMAKSTAALAGVVQRQPGGRMMYGITISIHHGKIYPCGAQSPKVRPLLPSGFCFAVNRTCWNSLGGFDERFRNGAEDVDFVLRAIEAKFSVETRAKYLNHMCSQSLGRFQYAAEAEDLLKDLWPVERYMKAVANVNPV